MRKVYLTDVLSSVVTPNQFLAGFQKTAELACVLFLNCLCLPTSLMLF